MADRVWDLFVELRKELLEAQKLRSQMIGFKIAFVGTAVGIIAEVDAGDPALFSIPAFAALSFDYLINSYSFSVKRIGMYTRAHVEPALLASGELPAGYTPWQRYLEQPTTKQHWSTFGNLGLTALAVLLAIALLVRNFRAEVSLPLMVALILFAVFDAISVRQPGRLGKVWSNSSVEGAAQQGVEPDVE